MQDNNEARAMEIAYQFANNMGMANWEQPPKKPGSGFPFPQLRAALPPLWFWVWAVPLAKPWRL